MMMFHESPTKAPRKPLEDISNSSNQRVLREHVTPKKRRLELSDGDKEDIGNGNIPPPTPLPQTPSGRKTPIRFSIPSSGKKISTPVETKHDIPSVISQSRGLSLGEKFEKAQKPFPQMDQTEKEVKLPEEQLHHKQPHQRTEENPTTSVETSIKGSIQRTSAEVLNKNRSRFRELSTHLHCLRSKYQVSENKDDTLRGDKSLPLVVYTEIPLVKAKLDGWKGKYGKKTLP